MKIYQFLSSLTLQTITAAPYSCPAKGTDREPSADAGRRPARQEGDGRVPPQQKLHVRR